MISLIFIVLASFCNAIMDILSFHFEKSVFKNLNPKWWNPSISWKNKYIDWDNGVRDERKWFFGLLKYPIFLTDAWHLFKSMMLCFLILSIVCYKPIISYYFDLCFLGGIWILYFNLLYNYSYKK